jgi:cobalt-zinc-cadmium efflux system membrane fusion protein
MRSPALRAGAVALFTFALGIPGCKERQGNEDNHGDDPKAADHEHAEEHTDEVKLTDAAIERYGVRVETASKRVLQPTITCPARVAFNAESMAHVGSPLRGRAVEIKARLGDEVKKDQGLVTIESPELGEAQSDFLQKRTAAQSAGPQAELARAAWDRAKALLEESQGISLTEVQRREAEYKAAVAAQKAAESAANAAENRLHLLGMDQEAVGALEASGEVAPRFEIRAPIDGRVVQREVTQGELVSPEREALLVLADTRTLWVLADVPEARLAEVALGAPAWISFGLLGGERLVGRVSFISPIVDPTTRTAQARVDIPIEGGDTAHLRPGMFARAEIGATARDGQEPAPVTVIPEEAVQSVEGGPAVFVPVMGEANTYSKRPVTIGAAVGGFVPVIAGLEAGEAFVVSGSFILKADLGKSTAAHEH